MDDFLYNDYASWKIENEELINGLKGSNIVSRFKHIYDVCEYIYNERINEKKIEIDLENIFDYGFDYLFSSYNNIELLYKEYFNSLKQMEKISKTINLYLYVQDFIIELENEEENVSENKKKLEDFSNQVLKYIKNHEEAPDEMFGLLDDLTYKMFKNYCGTIEIFYEIAQELGVVTDSDDYYEI